MPLFASRGEQRARSFIFDDWAEAAKTCLLYPEIQNRLGALSAQLLTVVDESFLPNVRHGQVVVPRSHHNRNGTAIVPRLPSDGHLYPSDSLNKPTPARVEKMAATLALAPQVPPEIKRRVLDGSMYDLRPDDPLPRPSANHAMAITHYRASYAEAEDLLFTTRPATILSEKMPDYHGVLLGATGVHEAVHSLDGEARTRPGPFDAAMGELRACEVTGILLRHARSNGLIRSSEMMDELATVVTVRTALEEFEIDGASLLDGRFAFGEATAPLADFLQWTGIVLPEEIPPA